MFHLSLEVEVLSWRPIVETPLARLPDAGPVQTRPLSILVVEDHPVNRAVLASFLAPLGHEVSLAEDGQIGLDQCAAQAFDLILMDVNMPVLDGLSATRRLRSHGGPNARTPIAVLSASARPEDMRLGFDAGADAYLTKPIDFPALLDLLAAAGRGRSAMQGAALRQAAA